MTNIVHVCSIRSHTLQKQLEQIQEIMVADWEEFVSCENLEPMFAKDAKVADSGESATEHAMEANTTTTDRQELTLRCYPTEKKLNVPQLINIEQERVIVSLELKAAEFIEAGISG